jgi:hypothetical protein
VETAEKEGKLGEPYHPGKPQECANAAWRLRERQECARGWGESESEAWASDGECNWKVVWLQHLRAEERARSEARLAKEREEEAAASKHAMEEERAAECRVSPWLSFC